MQACYKTRNYQGEVENSEVNNNRFLSVTPSIFHEGNLTGIQIHLKIKSDHVILTKQLSEMTRITDDYKENNA